MYLSQFDTPTLIDALGCFDLRQDHCLGVFLGQDEHPDLEDLRNRLGELGVPFFGGVFPGVVHGGRKYSRGGLLTPLPALVRPQVVRDPGAGPDTIPSILGDLARENPQGVSLLVLVNGLFPHIGAFLKDLYHVAGSDPWYFGGGAGTLELVRQPCLFDSDGVYQDAALVLPIPASGSLGVRHGWEVLQDRLLASRTAGNVLKEINWDGAFPVYRKIVEEDSGLSFEKEDFFRIAKGYPFGMLREGGEHIIRDPIARGVSDEMVCVAEIPENATLAIMKGKPENLVQAAREAATEGLRGLDPSTRRSGVWIMDCISRAIYLEDRFEEELQAVQEKVRGAGVEEPLRGLLTLGEIASLNNRGVAFLNKTIVVGAFHV